MAPLATPPVSEGIPSPSEEIADGLKAETNTPLRRAVYVHVSDLAQPYNIDPEKLKAEVAKIKCTEVTTDEVVAGKIEQETLTGKKQNELKNLGQDMDKLEINSIESSPRVQKKGQYHQKLHPPSGGFNLCLLVGKVNVVVDKLRVDRSRVRVAEVEVGDETGTVSLRARDEQIDMLEAISDQKGAAVLRNCTLELYQGRHLRLAITKWGKLRAYPDDIASTPPPPKQINQELNYSCVDLNLVVGETKASEISPASSTSDKHRRQLARNTDSKNDDASSIRTSSSNQSRQHQMWRGGEGLEAKRNPYYYRHGQISGPAFGMPYQEGGISDQAHHILFSPVQSFAPLYSDGSMSVPQYGYPAALPKRAEEGQQSYYQRNIPDNSQRREHQYKHQQQQLLMQQYEMQQRQMQQMQMFQQQERQRQLFEPHRQQQPHQLQSPFIDPELLRTGSIDGSGEYFPVSPSAGDHHPTMVPMIGPDGQVLIPQMAGTIPVISGSQQPSEKPLQPPHMFQADSNSAESHHPSALTGNEPSKRSGSYYRGGSVPVRHDRTRQKQPVDATASVKTGGGGGYKHRPSGGNVRGAVRGSAHSSSGYSKQYSTNRRKVHSFSGGEYAVPYAEEPQFIAAHNHEQQPLPANLQPTMEVDASTSLGHMNPDASSFDPSYTKSQGMMQAQPTAYTYVPYSPQQAAGAIYGTPGTSHQPPIYSQGVMYVPAVPGAAMGAGNVAPMHISHSHESREPGASGEGGKASSEPTGTTSLGAAKMGHTSKE